MTYAGLLMVLSLVLAARALTAGRPRPQRVVDGALALAAVLLVGLTFTRSAYLGLAAGAVVLVLTARPRLALAVPPLAVLLVLVLPAGVRERAASTFDRTDAAARDRLAMWSSGATMISERPFFGVGPGRITELYPVYRQPEFVEARVGHLHNNLVNVAAETGVPSALAYLAIVGTVFAAGWPLSRDRSRPAVRSLARGALAANAALFVAGMFEYNFGDVEILRLMLVVLALPFAAARRRAPAPGLLGSPGAAPPPPGLAVCRASLPRQRMRDVVPLQGAAGPARSLHGADAPVWRRTSRGVGDHGLALRGEAQRRPACLAPRHVGEG
ncbi:MAG: O-antigen ligase family protein [Holophagales bacterium]|nr:O-antigen ligase family protein [Holophagales bacterium]